MKFSDSQIRNIAKLRDDLYAKIRKYQEEVEMLEGNLEILDVILKESSFTKASSLMEDKKTNTETSVPSTNIEDSIPITNPEGQVMAKAYVTPDRISIMLDDSIEISSDTPPLKSFFLERIIGGMKTKDASEADTGKIQRESVIDCTVKKADSHLKEIVITNYRLKERVNEIINTASWSLSRMLENVKK